MIASTRRKACGALIVALLGGCSTSLRHGPRAIKFWHPETGQVDERALDALIAETNKENPRLPVEGQTMPGDYTAFRQKLHLAFMGGAPPPLFTSGPGYMLAAMAREGRIAPVGDVWQAVDANHIFPDGLRRGFLFRNVPYSIPSSSSFITNIFYSKPIFAKLGLSIPRSWKDFIDCCAAIKRAGYQAIAHSQGASFTFYHMLGPLFSTLGQRGYYALANGNVPLNSQPVLSAFSLFSQAFANNYITDWSGYSWTGAADEFMRGRTGMFAAGGWVAVYMNGVGARPGIDYEVFASPAFGRGGIVQSDGIAISAGLDAADDRAARAFLTAAVGVKAQSVYISRKQAVPANRLTPLDALDPVARRAADMITDDPRYPVLPNVLFMLPNGFGSDLATATERFALDHDEAALRSSLAGLERTRLSMKAAGGFIRWQ